jgi:hypothetical protein
MVVVLWVMTVYSSVWLPVFQRNKLPPSSVCSSESLVNMYQITWCLCVLGEGLEARRHPRLYDPYRNQSKKHFLQHSIKLIKNVSSSDYNMV